MKTLIVALSMLAGVSLRALEVNEFTLRGCSKMIKLEQVHGREIEKKNCSSCVKSCISTTGTIFVFISVLLITRELYIRYLSYSIDD